LPSGNILIPSAARMKAPDRQRKPPARWLASTSGWIRYGAEVREAVAAYESA